MNDISVTEMSVTVRVLTVDGSRRMSHNFFDQIPRRDVILEDGELVEGAELWGQVNLDRDWGWNSIGVEIVWSLDGAIYVARHYEDTVGTLEDQLTRTPSDFNGETLAIRTNQCRLAVKYAEKNLPRARTIERLRDELPQLYVGG